MDKVIGQSFKENGYYTPISILTAEEAAKTLQNFNLYKDTVGTNGKIIGDFRFQGHLLMKWVWDLIRHPKIVSVVKEALDTENILCWGTDFNIKPGKSQGYFTWHQDATYCGLTPINKMLTAWIAITPSTTESGCLCFLPKTHSKRLDHIEKQQEHNMLSLGQEIADQNFIEKRLSTQVYAELVPGQMSLHHSYMVHASGPNETETPRIGLAIRYLAAEVRKEPRFPSMERVTLISGIKQHDFFEYEHAPVEDFSDDAFQEHKLSIEREKENYFFGKSIKSFK
uniref:Phytanoyl-CoA dioxygenase n=1 Tax=Clytia hemisphaerica TaxID=252671 RepID=A0A7M5VDV9_9CNID